MVVDATTRPAMLWPKDDDPQKQTVTQAVYSPELDATGANQEWWPIEGESGFDVVVLACTEEPLSAEELEAWTRQRSELAFSPTELKRGLGREKVISADILIPTEVRRLVRMYGTDRVWIVPDGALHQLPFESLVLDVTEAESRKPGTASSVTDDGATPARPFDGWKFVLDEWAPIVYLPSAAVGFQQLKRSRREGKSSKPDHENRLTLLTVGNPAYRSRPRVEDLNEHASRGLTRRTIWLQELPGLPGTADECRRVHSVFGPNRSTLLLGSFQDKRPGRWPSVVCHHTNPALRAGLCKRLALRAECLEQNRNKP